MNSTDSRISTTEFAHENKIKGWSMTTVWERRANTFTHRDAGPNARTMTSRVQSCPTTLNPLISKFSHATRGILDVLVRDLNVSLDLRLDLTRTCSRRMYHRNKSVMNVEGPFKFHVVLPPTTSTQAIVVAVNSHIAVVIQYRRRDHVSTLRFLDTLLTVSLRHSQEEAHIDSTVLNISSQKVFRADASKRWFGQFLGQFAKNSPLSDCFSLCIDPISQKRCLICVDGLRLTSAFVTCH